MSKADIAREAKISNLNSVDQQRVLTKLVADQYIKSDVRKANRKHCRGLGSNEQQMWSLNYLSKDGDVAFTISDYNNFVYRYLNYVYGGYFVCSGCGKIFKQNNNAHKYCKKCANELKRLQTNILYDPIGSKKIICIDCGKEFEIGAKDNQTDRCPECYKKYRRDCIRENVRNYRNKAKM